MHVEKLLFSKVGWYEPLNKYLDNPNLTAPDYNWKDFGPAGTYWGLKGDGTILAIPWASGSAPHVPEGPLRREGPQADDDPGRADGRREGAPQAAGGLRLRGSRT